MAADITKYGTGLPGLKGLNYQDNDNDILNQIMNENLNLYLPKNNRSIGVAAAQAGFGDSQYDENVTSESQFNDLNEVRYANQPWYDTLANGIGKMLGTAGTTFLSSLVGLPTGIATAIGQGRVSGLWDNSVTEALGKVDEWMENNMTNYKSQAQQEAPWYSLENLGSMNFWADDVIKNAGFTLGAATSMTVGAGTMGLLGKSLGIVNQASKGTRVANNLVSALFSATGEGMIEARQGVEERNKLELQRLDDELKPQYDVLNQQMELATEEYNANKGQQLVRGADGTMYDPAYMRYKEQVGYLNSMMQSLDEQKKAGEQEIIESGRRMGNMILAANIPVLAASDLIQFSKGITKSFDNARHAAEVASKHAKPFGVTASRVSDSLKEGYQLSGKNIGRANALLKGPLTEMSEEMNQQWIQSASGEYHNKKDVNDYWKAKLDPESMKETTDGLHTLGSAISQGFRDSWGDKDQWEQGFVGALTGFAGSYMPTKIFNQDRSKSRLNPMRYGEWSGGSINNVRDFNEEYRQYEENVNELNRLLQEEDVPERVRSLTGHTYTEKVKDAAAEDNDKKTWKDADDKQAIHDIQTFIRAGKLDDLKAIYDEVGRTMSDEDVENLVRSTTKEITAEEDKQNFDRQTNEQIAANQGEIDSLNEDLTSLQDALINTDNNGERAYIESQIADLQNRREEAYNNIAELNAQKENYKGQRYFIGPYVDNEGNKTITDDEVREQTKHNAEELQRKLNSYLDSVDYVNRRTNGQLTKDQEDNLAYLHNLGKESITRMNKIMTDVRSQLPSTFLLKTNKTPEQLTREYASSDLTFSKDEDTKEGYVAVDTSLMNDISFADFFQREVVRGGNIDPEFAETAAERAAREAEEKNLPSAEKKKKAKERATKKWQDAMNKRQEDAKEQWSTNWDLMVDNFINNYKKNNVATLDETLEAFSTVAQDLIDASELYNQAGEFERTLQEYMANPSLVDRDKEKEEQKAAQEETKDKLNTQFGGKTAQDINKDIASGAISDEEVEDFLGMNLDDLPDGSTLLAAKEEAQKSKDIRQKQAALKNHLQEQIGDAPTTNELKALDLAMRVIDNAAVDVASAEELNIGAIETAGLPVDAFDINATMEDIDTVSQDVHDAIANAFNSLREDESAREDIPDTPVTVSDIETPTTGYDETTKVAPEVVAPKETPRKAEEKIIPVNPIKEEDIGSIIDSARRTPERAESGAWRSTTTRYIYGSSYGTYHENIAKERYGENSKEYKRSKAIWEYLNSVGAFDRLDNADEDRIKAGDTVHMMVKYLPDVFGKDYSGLTDEEKPYSLVMLMVNEYGEILGDLPLAQLEPSYKSGSPTENVRLLASLQDRAFKAFDDNRGKTGSNIAVVDDILHIEGADNLGLKFKSGNPLTVKVAQVMRGAIPYIKTETNTLNDVANGMPFEIGVRVTDAIIATSKNLKERHPEIRIPEGSSGQPYLLLPTPSGEKMAVPFYMKPFDAEKHKDTEFYKQLCNAVYYLLRSYGMEDEKKKTEYFHASMDVVRGLLQVENQPGKAVISVDKNTQEVSMHLQSLTNPDQKIDKTIRTSNDSAQDAIALVSQLSGIPINVSLEFINGNIKTGVAANEGRTSPYNQLIGEIADVNLPRDTHHTVNGWFTVSLASQNENSNFKIQNSKLEGQSAVGQVSSTGSDNSARENSGTGLSLEEIEKIVRDNGLVTDETQDAWAAIPDELKLTMANDGASIRLTYPDATVTVDFNNTDIFKKALAAANNYALRGKLKVTEGVKAMPKDKKTDALQQREREKEAREWLTRNLPTLSSKERTQFVEKIAREGSNANKMWGNYRSGVVEIQRNAPMGTVYHESFHYVMDMVLDADERAQVLSLARDIYQTTNNWVAEERLAEDFRRYALDENATGIVGTLKKWLRKIMDKMKRYNRISDDTINQLFLRINNGEMAQRAVGAEQTEGVQQTILREIRNVQIEKYSWNNLDADTRENLRASGLTKESYERMSLEEQQQYVRCRG